MQPIPTPLPAPAPPAPPATGAGRRRLPALVLVPALGAALALATLSGGCQKPLFSERYERTQYDRYDRSRNQFARQYTEDEFGRKEPNLWGRLAPKE